MQISHCGCKISVDMYRLRYKNIKKVEKLQLKLISVGMIFSIILSGCAAKVEHSGTIIVKSPEKQKTTLSRKKIAESNPSQFSYLSKKVLDKGPCPDRDPKSYGLLMESKTITKDTQVTCFYN